MSRSLSSLYLIWYLESINFLLNSSFQTKYHKRGITRDGYKKHCLRVHGKKICLKEMVVTEEVEPTLQTFTCVKCHKHLSRQQTYDKHMKYCKGKT